VSIYVETLIQADLEDVWRHTQTPELHARWDLRFTDIRYLPRSDPAAPQRFVYETRIGLGWRIQGEGETVAAREDSSGVRTSSLRFWSEDPKSLIRVGSGYWQYIPTNDGVRFLTRYQYETRFGLLGQLFNTGVFEPLLGWATAWSFDRLRLQLEHGVDPAAALDRSVVHAVARFVLAVIWVYQGLVPKLLYPDTGEREIIRRTRLIDGAESIALRLLAVGEIIFGLGLLRLWRARSLLLLNTLALVGLTAGAARTTPALFRAPFNPASLNLAMAALSVIGYAASRNLPSATRCLRHPKPPPRV
jgi:DoxX-like family